MRRSREAVWGRRMAKRDRFDEVHVQATSRCGRRTATALTMRRARFLPLPGRREAVGCWRLCWPLVPTWAGGADAAATHAATAGCGFDVTSAPVGAFVDVFADPQFAVTARSPQLGATTCGPVDHWWTFAATGVPPELKFGPGPRHTAGPLPAGPYTLTTYDSHTFHLGKTVLWPGPGTHVHLRAYDPSNKLILDPFFEYDVALPP